MLVVVVRRLRRGGRNGEDRGVTTTRDLRWRSWSRDRGNRSTVAIFKRQLDGGWDHLATAAGIAAVVVMAKILSGGVCSL